MRLSPIFIVLCAGLPAAAQSFNNNLNPLGGPAQLQVNMNPNWAPALGDGRGLERDFSGMGLGNYNSRDFAADARFRNNVVNAGPVAASTGYGYSGLSANTNRSFAFGANRLGANTNRNYNTLANHFNAPLSADDLFSFRRDALSSGAASLGVRGTESLQYLYGYATANKFAIPSPRTAGLSGPGAPVNTPAPVFAPTAWEPRPIPAHQVTDFSGLGSGWSDVAPQFGTLRSTSSFLSNRALNPSVIGVKVDQYTGNTQSLTASPMLGVRETPSRRSDRVDLAASTAVQRAIDPVTGRPMTAPATTPTEATTEEYSTLYNDVLDRFAKSSEVKPLEGTPADEAVPAWKARLSKLKEQILTSEIEPTAEDQKLTPEQSAEKRREASKAFDPDTLRLIRQAGGEVKAYGQLDGMAQRLYAKYMNEGSKALAEKRYFDAEEQFVRCLAIAPGDPTVSAARLNAQIGAALYLSAALNAKALFEAHPEMIGVRYTEGAIPSPERLKTVAAHLRQRVEEARSIKEPPPRDAAFLLAYIGYQTGDEAMTREGLDLLDETYAKHPEPLVPILRGVWLESK